MKTSASALRLAMGQVLNIFYKLTIQENDSIPLRRHLEYLLDLLPKSVSFGAKLFSMQVVKRTSCAISDCFRKQRLSRTRGPTEQGDETLAFAYNHIVQARLCTLMVFDKGQNEVFLRFWVDQMIVGFVIPLEGFDVVDVEFD